MIALYFAPLARQLSSQRGRELRGYVATFSSMLYRRARGATCLLLVASLACTDAYVVNGVPRATVLAARSSPPLAQCPAPPARGMLLAVASPAAMRGLDLIASGLKLGWRLGLAAAATMLLTRVALAALDSPPVAAAVSRVLRRVASLTVRLAEAAAARHYRLVQNETPPSPAASVRSPAANTIQSPAATSARSTATAQPPATKVTIRRRPSDGSAPAAGVPGSSEAALLNEIGQMRVKQIKQELDELGVPHADAVEKSELVDRLVRARKAAAVGARTAATPANPPAAPAAPPPPPSTSAASGAPYRFGLEDMADLPEGVLPENVSKESALEAMNQLMNDPKGFELLMELQSNPRVMQAAMEMSTGGEAAAQKYAKDPEVQRYMERVQQLMGLEGN